MALKLICPCCGAKLVVDPDTGAILSHEKKAAKSVKDLSLAEALQAEQQRKQQLEEKFKQASSDYEHREEILQKKFDEAKKKVKDDDTPPPHPMDWD